MLTIENLVKRYGDITAIDDVSFSIEDDEFFSIVGPSGSGKSTMLRCITGLEYPDEGTIRIGTDEVTNAPPYERSTAMVFQNLALFPHMTVKQNIKYGMKRHGVPAEEIKKGISNTLSLVDLEGYEQRDISELSGGEQQRVALARSLAVEPELLLLDEPLASLDQKLRHEVKDELAQLQQELDKPFVYVTHDQSIALSMSDRVAIMNEGGVEQIGAPMDIYQNPASLFVSRFIGTTTEFAGTVEATDGDQISVAVDDEDLTLTGIPVDELAVGDDCVLAVKTEKPILEPNGTAENEIDGTVTKMTFQGQSSTIRTGLEGGTTVNIESTTQYASGDAITFGLRTEDCHVFESA